MNKRKDFVDYDEVSDYYGREKLEGHCDFADTSTKQVTVEKRRMRSRFRTKEIFVEGSGNLLPAKDEHVMDPFDSQSWMR